MATGKIILVTGSTDGIGRETARQLVREGAQVIVHGRNEAKAADAVKELESIAGRSMPRPAIGDFASLAEIHRMAEDLLARDEPLDVLLNNAGIYVRERKLSADGFELTMAINHFAPFLLTHLLLPLLRHTSAPRIINVSSIAHSRAKIDLNDLQLENNFDHYRAYAASKLANVLFTVELSKRLGGGISVNALHPGVVSTKLLTDGFQIEGRDSLTDSATTSVYLATSSEIEGVTGQYFANQQQAAMNPLAADNALLEGFYLASCELTGVEPLPR